GREEVGRTDDAAAVPLVDVSGHLLSISRGRLLEAVITTEPFQDTGIGHIATVLEQRGADGEADSLADRWATAGRGDLEGERGNRRDREVLRIEPGEELGGHLRSQCGDLRYERR